MSNSKKLRKAISKELALELRGRKRKQAGKPEETEIMQLIKDQEARNN